MAKLKVVVGSMFSGKSTSLLRDREVYTRAGKRVVVVKPDCDTRYSTGEVVTHNGVSHRAITVNPTSSLLDYEEIAIADVVLIDEVQFFSISIFKDIRYLRALGKVVIVYGLDMDFRGVPFEITSYLMGVANEVEKINTICAICGEEAWVTEKINGNKNRVELGSDDLYKPVCFTCYER